MPECSDAELELELKAWKDLHDGQKKAKCPNAVIAQSERMVGFLEELISWRVTGKKWLKIFNQEKEKNGKVHTT